MKNFHINFPMLIPLTISLINDVNYTINNNNKQV
jgi:hypothetical protein